MIQKQMAEKLSLQYRSLGWTPQPVYDNYRPLTEVVKGLQQSYFRTAAMTSTRSMYSLPGLSEVVGWRARPTSEDERDFHSPAQMLGALAVKVEEYAYMQRGASWGATPMRDQSKDVRSIIRSWPRFLSYDESWVWASLVDGRPETRERTHAEFFSVVDDNVVLAYALDARTAQSVQQSPRNLYFTHLPLDLS